MPILTGHVVASLTVSQDTATETLRKAQTRDSEIKVSSRTCKIVNEDSNRSQNFYHISCTLL